MTYVLTNDELADLQGDTGIGVDENVFTNDELNRLFNRAEGDYDKTVVFTLRQLLAQTAKFFNYSVAQTKYDRNQLFQNVSRLLARWEAQTGLSGSSLSAGVISLGLDQTDDTETS